MKISYNWLKQFINLDWDAEKTGELLTDLGLEVESIESFESVKGALKGIVVGKVITCVQHPNADRLKLTTVDIGKESLLQIVCGAPNVEAGQKVPVATIGTTLYDEKGTPWEIKKGKIRGEDSEGMICAEDELGLGQNHEGIMVLSENAIIGTPLSNIIEVESDEVFEIGLTPNRADAMSHWGTARDLRAGLLHRGIQLEFITPSNSNFRVNNRTHKITVEILNKELAPRYCGVTISGIKVEESPVWIQNRLKAIGIKPKNNIVDITNYVLHELGQPLHAFDSSKISGGKIQVKTVASGTKFTTLDDIEHELHEEDLMICDAEKPLCIAGVLGGIESGVSEKTTSIFLESAYFQPVSIRKTAKRHAINTDASFRFERGIDPNCTEYALMRAAVLIKEIAGGEISSDVIDLYPKKIEDFQVFLSFEKTAKLIGQDLPKETIKNILTSLEIKINNITETGLGLTIPAYRNDVTREADVVEEILRVYGYNNIHFSEKLNASISKTNKIEDYQIQNKIAAQLNGQGFFEMMANSLTNAKYAAINEVVASDETITILNPLSQDLSALRQTLLFSALEAIAYNRNRKRPDIKLFEFGKSYHNTAEGKKEQKHLSITITGNRNTNHWHTAESKSDFFYLKGIVDAVFSRFGITSTITSSATNSIFSEGIIYSENNEPLVSFGVIKKSILNQMDIEGEVLYADFQWDSILNNIKSQNHKLKEIPKFQQVKRDFALLIDNQISFQQIHDISFQTEKKLLKDVTLFDVYQGKNLPKGKKSYAVSFTLLDTEKTLTDKQIDKIMNKLQLQFETEIGAELR
ncbi:MAG: phenylalanine--tRNA ligase subunit beta [Bacteroidetes bacterium HGW-Bacteroidetes-2]|jgi:phenylalanyl-tRNA synthetase beta chain|nr:MAG: phenylalanine--tRNA ligase subunit beta [Bacteroidetes bacterium HGW-Bacteroidetes-2]